MKPITPMEAVLGWLETQRSPEAAHDARQAYRRYLRLVSAYERGKSTSKPVQPLGWLRRYLLGQDVSESFIKAAEDVHRQQHRRLNQYKDRVRTFEALQARLVANLDRYGEQHPATDRTRQRLEQLQVELWT
jgi:hypothetical protein